jgi:hypothetical protein
MGLLIDRVAEMEKQAAAQAQHDAEVAVLVKYASAAENLLAAEFGDDYNAADVEELAAKMIDHDLNELEKQASAEDASPENDLISIGRIIGQGIKMELQNA